MGIAVPSQIYGYLGLDGGCLSPADRNLIETIQPMAESVLCSYLGYRVEQATYTHYVPAGDDISTDDINGLDVVHNRVVFDVDGAANRLYLPQRPIRSISSLYEDSASEGGQGSGDFSGTALTAGTDYYIDYTASGVGWSGCLVRIAGTWPARRRTVKVTYVAGFTAAELLAGELLGPDESTSIRLLQYAAVLTVAAAYGEAKRHQPGVTGAIGPIQSERLADYSVTYATNYIKHLSMIQQLPPKVMEIADKFRRLAV